MIEFCLIKKNLRNSRLISVQKGIWHQSQKIASSSNTNSFNKLSPKITKLQVIGCEKFLLYSSKYLNNIIYFYFIFFNYWLLGIIVFSIIFIQLFEYYYVFLFFLLLVLVYLYTLWFVVLWFWGKICWSSWCRMRMRPVRLVSHAFLYTTILFDFLAYQFSVSRNRRWN